MYNISFVLTGKKLLFRIFKNDIKIPWPLFSAFLAHALNLKTLLKSNPKYPSFF